MTLIAVTIPVMIALFGVLGLTRKDYDWTWRFNAKQLATPFACVILIFGLFTEVNTNNVGIVYNQFTGVKTQTLSEGFHTKSLFETVTEISTEVQTVTITDLTTQTKDSQWLNTALDIKYRVNEFNAYMVYKQFKNLNNVNNTLIEPTTQRVLELVTIHYNIIDALGEKRSDIYGELIANLSKELANYGIEFYTVTITDMDAGADLEREIAAEAVAKKAVETAEQRLKQAEIDARKEIVEAEAAQETAKIKAETTIINATAEKEANELLTQTLNDAILRKEWIDKWNGEMPTYYGGNADIMFNVE